MISHQLCGLIAESARIAVVAHIMPDGDALGSCLALGHALGKMGKTIHLYCDDPHPPVYDFLKGIDSFKSPDDHPEAYDLCIAVDCSDIGRMGRCAAIFQGCPVTANIDHHISNNGYADYNWVDATAAASGEIIFELVNNLGIHPDQEMAEALYTALSTDTGSFNFSSTTSRTYQIAAHLMDCGIDVDAITTRLFRTFSLEKIRLLAGALDTLELHADNQIAFLSVTREMLEQTGARDSDTENLINYARNIEGVAVAVLLKEAADGTTKASFRGNETVDVAALAGIFGGGGHKKAAGASLGQDISAARQAILAALKKLFKELSSN